METFRKERASKDTTLAGDSARRSPHSDQRVAARPRPGGPQRANQGPVAKTAGGLTAN